MGFRGYEAQRLEEINLTRQELLSTKYWTDVAAKADEETRCCCSQQVVEKGREEHEDVIGFMITLYTYYEKNINLCDL